jgi:anthranilate phosphoribosyltransferase
MSDLKPFLAKVADGNSLSEADAEAAFEVLMSGTATPAQIGGFLMALRVRGESVSEITGAAKVMRAKALTIDSPPGTIDTCGTGGDGAGTYNISTAVALVTAACGVPVAKHGNRAVSSKSGAADVLAALGVNIEASPEVVARALRETNIGFLFAPKHHSAMKFVAPIRQELAQRTIFNLCGPLSNPAGAKRQLIGVFAHKWIIPVAETLARLGSERAWVVHGSDGLDEITTTGTTFVAELDGDTFRTFEVVPEDAGLKRAKPEELTGGDAATNAAAMRTLLHGRGGPYRDIVVLNSAAALVIAGKAPNLKDGAAIALDAIMSGKAAKVLAALVAVTHNKPVPA